MNRMVIVSGLTFVLIGVATTKLLAEARTPDQTQPVVKLTKITCKDFLVLDPGERLKLIYWVEGFSQKGPEEEAVVDFSKTEQLVAAVTKTCDQQPYELLWKKVKAESKSERRTTPAIKIESSSPNKK